MTDRLTPKDWLDEGLRMLTARGFTALRAESVAKALGVSRGSFYWHFADVEAFHAAVLKHWRDVAAERIIAGIEAAHAQDEIAGLLRRAFGQRLDLERAARAWAAVDPVAKKAARAIDRRRLAYVERMLARAGLPSEVAAARARILYWAFLGYVQSDKALPSPQQAIVLDELIAMAMRGTGDHDRND